MSEVKSKRSRAASAVKKFVKMVINPEALARATVTSDADRSERERKAKVTFSVAKPAPHVLPKDKELAMDALVGDIYAYASTDVTFAEGLQFMGYPYLSELTQRAEYRRPAEILAKEMTRKWIKFSSSGKEDKSEKIGKIEAEFTRLHVQSLFRQATEQDGFFGRSQIYVDMGVDFNSEELKAPLLLKPETVKGKTIKRLTMVEPIWSYPNFYEASNPLDPKFFRPQTWFVLGMEIHSTRLLTFVSHKVPDILKPAYAFGGLSLSQMLKPYVDNWLRTRQSVSDILHAFSVFVLKTNMSELLNGGAAEQLFNRLEVFNRMRDNRGLFMIDQATEDFSNVSAPLSGLDHLQAQSQEHMSAVVGAPLIVMFGISPSGLNASSEGEMKAFQDWVAGKQEADLSPNLTTVLHLVELSLFGEIDPDIGFAWVPLWTLDAKQASDMRKQDADTDAIYIDRGVIDPSESRKRIAMEKDSPYSNLDLDKKIVPPDQQANENDLMDGLGLGQPGGEAPPGEEKPPGEGKSEGEKKDEVPGSELGPEDKDRAGKVTVT